MIIIPMSHSSRFVMMPDRSIQDNTVYVEAIKVEDKGSFYTVYFSKDEDINPISFYCKSVRKNGFEQKDKNTMVEINKYKPCGEPNY